MKGTFLCLLLAFANTSVALAAPPGTTQITVTGRAAIELAPNLAIVSAGLQSNAATAAEALASNNAAYERVVGALGGLGIARADIALSSYNVSYVAPRTGQSDGSERTGYTVSRDFSVKVRNVEKAGTVTDACIGAGATAINGVQFTLSDTAAVRTQAVALAVADARRNAELVARDAGLHLAGIVSISLDNAGDTGGPVVLRMAARPTAFDQGTVAVSASVTAVFLAQP